MRLQSASSPKSGEFRVKDHVRKNAISEIAMRVSWLVQRREPIHTACVMPKRRIANTMRLTPT
jgi:hypothetical protein